MPKVLAIWFSQEIQHHFALVRLRAGFPDRYQFSDDCVDGLALS
jgi:hypothetical protein